MKRLLQSYRVKESNFIVILFIKLALYIVLSIYTSTIIKDRYSTDKYVIATNWTLYLLSFIGIVVVTFFYESDLVSYIITGLILLQTIAILMSKPWTIKVVSYLNNTIIFLVILTLFGIL